MVADKEVVRDRINRIRTYRKDLQGFSKISLEVFKQNRERQYAVLHALQLAVEACIDIATHICSADALGVPASYAEAFNLLENANILDQELGLDLRAMARFRNRIVHFYWEMDLEEIYRILQEHREDFLRYIQAIETYLS